MMQAPQYDTIVRSVSGEMDLRQVLEVDEWRIEQVVNSDRVVISIVTSSGEGQSFLLKLDDAQDIGEVLRRKVGPPCINS